MGAGSGPYTLSAYSTTSQISLVPNTSYWGSKKAAFTSVVVRNMVAATQLLNVARDPHEIEIDLSADQAQTLKSNKSVNVSLQPSTWVFWLFTNTLPYRRMLAEAVRLMPVPPLVQFVPLPSVMIELGVDGAGAPSPKFFWNEPVRLYWY